MRAAHAVHYIRAKGPITFELWLIEELVSSGFVGEGGMCALVMYDIFGFVAVNRRLDIDQNSVFRIRTVALTINL